MTDPLLTDRLADPGPRERGAVIAVWSDAQVQFLSPTSGPRLRVARAGEGPPLLLINGLGANLEMWKPFARETW